MSKDIYIFFYWNFLAKVMAIVRNVFQRKKASMADHMHYANGSFHMFWTFYIPSNWGRMEKIYSIRFLP